MSYPDVVLAPRPEADSGDEDPVTSVFLDRWATCAPGSVRCPGCGDYVDVTTCWCGDDRDAHTPYTANHGFVPLGCTCHERST